MALNNAQYDAIIREYNKKQLDNMHLLNQRKEEIYGISEEFQKIDHKISSLSVAQAKKILLEDESSIQPLKDQIAELSLQRESLLIQAGYPADYLQMQYHCNDCKDTGYTPDNQKCSCFLRAAIELLYTQSNLKNIVQVENFDNFSYKYYSEDIVNPATGLNALQTAQKIMEESKLFIQNFDTAFANIFLYGDTGVGKTFLSNCIAKELMDSCHSVIYFTAFELFDLFGRNTFSRDTVKEDVRSYVFDSDLLIIDDLGTELTNSFVSSQLFLCINERLLRKKSTIISTNLPINTFVDTYSERTFSRISSNYKMWKLIGNDIRIQKKLSANKLDRSIT